MPLISDFSVVGRSRGLFGFIGARLAAGRYKFVAWLLSRPAGLWGLRIFFAIFRGTTPFVRLGGLVAPMTHDATVDALERADDFQVADGLAGRMPAGPFVMNIDDPVRHGAERALLRQALGDGDEPEIQSLRKLVKTKAAMRLGPSGKIDVARDYTEELTLDVVHGYFGIGTDSAKDRKDLRMIFRFLAAQIFQSPPPGSEMEAKTLEAQQDLMKIALGSLGRGGDTVLARLEAIAAARPYPWATEEWAARNAASLAAFGSGTVARATTQIVFRLLELDGAKEIAKKAACAYLDKPTPESRDVVLLVAMEALRFNPMLPLIGPRRATRGVELETACPHLRTRVERGETVMPSPFAAMFDPVAFPQPGRFRIEDRKLDRYLHFGGGRHLCVGKRAAEAQIEEIVTALFSKRSLKLADGVKRITYDYPAVEKLKVVYNA